MYYYCVKDIGYKYQVSEERDLTDQSHLVYGQTADKWLIPTEGKLQNFEVLSEFFKARTAYNLFLKNKDVAEKENELLKIVFTMQYFCVSLDCVCKSTAQILKEVGKKHGLSLT